MHGFDAFFKNVFYNVTPITKCGTSRLPKGICVPFPVTLTQATADFPSTTTERCSFPAFPCTEPVSMLSVVCFLFLHSRRMDRGSLRFHCQQLSPWMEPQCFTCPHVGGHRAQVQLCHHERSCWDTRARAWALLPVAFGWMPQRATQSTGECVLTGEPPAWGTGWPSPPPLPSATQERSSCCSLAGLNIVQWVCGSISLWF